MTTMSTFILSSKDPAVCSSQLQYVSLHWYLKKPWQKKWAMIHASLWHTLQIVHTLPGVNGPSQQMVHHIPILYVHQLTFWHTILLQRELKTIWTRCTATKPLSFIRTSPPWSLRNTEISRASCWSQGAWDQLARVPALFASKEEIWWQGQQFLQPEKMEEMAIWDSKVQARLDYKLTYCWLRTGLTIDKGKMSAEYDAEANGFKDLPSCILIDKGLM